MHSYVWVNNANMQLYIHVLFSVNEVWHYEENVEDGKNFLSLYGSLRMMAVVVNLLFLNLSSCYGSALIRTQVQ